MTSPVESDLLLASWRTVIKNAIFVRGKSLAFRIFHAQISHGCWSIFEPAFFSIPLLYFLFFLSFIQLLKHGFLQPLFSAIFPVWLLWQGRKVIASSSSYVTTTHLDELVTPYQKRSRTCRRLVLLVKTTKSRIILRNSSIPGPKCRLYNHGGQQEQCG